MLRMVYIIFSLLLLVTGISFAVINAESVTLHYYFGYVEMPLSMAMILSVIAGAIMGIIAGLGIIIRLKRENHNLKKSHDLVEKEISNLRTMPIKDKH